ncbi:copper resistance protein CopD [Saccharomonospora sp. CUA-673]|uniref:copper resistance D family protein n=1 Tax=Saccharomonospora sp. CUA-673 TaxID=1904969 RepID=UPI000968942A|nr:CopD family protein [Saccharomonospora sp. CUA-673]OLT40590.1 copper resistance protein CopD [Saccharomonospora sp. CUA-673]
MNRAETASRPNATVLIGLLTAAVAGSLIGFALTATEPVEGVAVASEAVSAGIPVARAVMNVAAVATIGLALLPVLLGRERPNLTTPLLAATRPAAIGAAGVWAAAATTTLLLQSAEYHPTNPDVAAYVADVSAGKALVLVAALALTLAVLGGVTLWRPSAVPPEVRVGLGLFALLPLPVTGHATGWSMHEYATISIELHVLAAVTWTGGLGAIAAVLAGNRTLLATALPRFSTLATVCLVAVTVTGAFNAFVELDAQPGSTLVASLFGTPYGLLVLLKVGCLAAAAALGGYLRMRLLPQVLRHRRTALARWATLELTVLGLAFGFAVVLTRTAPG